MREPFIFIPSVTAPAYTPIDLSSRAVDAKYHSARPLPADLITQLRASQIVIQANDEDDLDERDDLDHWIYNILTGDFDLLPPVLGRQSGALVFDDETGGFIPLDD